MLLFLLELDFLGILKIKRFFMIRVVESISDKNIGGAGVLLLNKIKNMNSEKIDITVLVPKGSVLTKKLRELKIRVIEINGCKNRSFDFKSLLSYISVIYRLSPDIINSHGCMNSRIAGFLASNAVNIYTRHCDFPLKDLYRNYFIKSIVRAVNFLLSDGIIAVSFSAKRNLISLGVSAKQIKVIINGAQALKRLSCEKRKEIKAQLNIPSGATVIGIFSRLEPYKDHFTFLRAVKLLAKSTNCYFIVVGSGSMDFALKKFSERIGILDRVRFCGFVEDVTPYMNITDINVNCSIGTETSSLALSEGMSLGIPCVVSDYPGNLYMVKNKVNGLVYRQRDYFSLAGAIRCLLDDYKLYSHLSKNAKARFDLELNARKMARETEEYYFSLLKKKKLSRGKSVLDSLRKN